MKRVNVGIIGLGNLGSVHAHNLAFHTPNAELIAVCRRSETKVKEAKERLHAKYAYTDFHEMIKNQELDAVVIVSPSALHCEQIQAALDAELHVFSEKPLGLSVEECQVAEAAVEAHPDKVFMLGFMRRYDPSYADAKAKIEAGEIGKPMLIKCTSCDPESMIDVHIKAAEHSGSWFQEMTPHDIDLARWFFNSDVTQVFALGGCYTYKEFEKYHDGDNVFAMMSFKNNAVAFFHSGKTAPHGYHVETEIVGTKGIIRISGEPMKNLNTLYTRNGVVKECIENFQERFAEAFRIEMQEFIDCILENRKPDVTVYDGTKATEIANAATQSFAEKKIVELEA